MLTRSRRLVALGSSRPRIGGDETLMKLWLSVVAALGLASCSAGQATAPATSSTTTTLSTTSTTVAPPGGSSGATHLAGSRTRTRVQGPHSALRRHPRALQGRPERPGECHRRHPSRGHIGCDRSVVGSWPHPSRSAEDLGHQHEHAPTRRCDDEGGPGARIHRLSDAPVGDDSALGVRSHRRTHRCAQVRCRGSR